jgi:hypothetical protein
MDRSRTRLSLTLAAAVLAAATAAHAAIFDVIKSGPDMVTVINPQAVETLGDGKVRRVQTVSIQKSLLSNGPAQPGYVNTLNEYDCGAWRTRWRSFSVYSRFGELVLRKDNPDPAWAPIDGNAEAVASAHVVCDGHQSGSVFAASSIGQLVIQMMQAWDVDAPPQPAPAAAPAPPAPAPKKKHRAVRP